MADPNFISDEELWALRYKLRRELIEFARRRLGLRQSQSDFIAFDQLLDPDALTIGFARRFATYKRAPLIFDQFENMSNCSTTAAGRCSSFLPARPIRATTTASATSSASFT
jgi:glucan phosphorylase